MYKKQVKNPTLIGSIFFILISFFSSFAQSKGAGHTAFEPRRRTSYCEDLPWCHSRLPWVGFCHFRGHVTTRAILLYSPCAFKCQIYLLLNTEFTELISFILNREAIQFGKWTFVDICKRFEEHIRHWTFIFFAENHSHRLYVNKERVDCEFSLCASDCATVLYFCGPWPYGLWTFGDICE